MTEFKTGDQFAIVMYCLGCKADVEATGTVLGFNDNGVMRVRYTHEHGDGRHRNVHDSCPACGGQRCKVYATEDQTNAASDQAALGAALGVEEKFRRAKALADEMYEAAPWAEQLKELCGLLFDLGVDLDATGNYNITGATDDKAVDPWSNVCGNCGKRIYVGRRIDGAWVWAHADTDLTTCREPAVDDWKPDREGGGMTMTLATAYPREPWSPPAPAEPVPADTPF